MKILDWNVFGEGVLHLHCLKTKLEWFVVLGKVADAAYLARGLDGWTPDEKEA